MGFITQHEVIQALKDEKSMAWDAFFTAYVPLIRLHGKDCGIKDEYLDDLVQDVMISVIKISKKFQYDPCKGRFRDFLKREGVRLLLQKVDHPGKIHGYFTQTL